MKKLKFQAPTGMHDILPEDQKYFRKINDVLESVSLFYGFQKIDTPIFEHAELYKLGLSTDIVGIQMFPKDARAPFKP
jgi:histidyl-tRNA synthetase